VDIVSAYPFLVVLVALAALAARIAVRRQCPDAIGPDTFLHLHMAMAIRSHGGLPKDTARTEYSTAYTYPFGYHWLLAMFPPQLMRPVERVTGGICDMLQTVWAGFIAFQLLELWGHTAGDAALGGLATAVLVAFSPAYLSIHGGPRAYMGSARPVGQLLFSIFVGSALLWQHGEGAAWIIPGVIAVALASVTSKFSNQAITLISLFACLFGEWHALAVGALGFALALLAFRGNFVNVIRGQIGHTLFYVRHLQAPYLDRALDTGPSYGQRMRTAFASARAYGLRYLVDWLFSDPNLIHKITLLYLPGLIGLGYLAIALTRSIALPDTAVPLAALVAASILAAIMTQTRRFRYLGESYRYVEHTVMLQAVLVTGMLVDTAPDILLAVLAATALLGTIALFQAARLLNEQYTPLLEQWANLKQALAAIDTPGTLVHPLSGWFWPVLCQTSRLRLAFYGVNCDINAFEVGRWEDLYANFPRPGRPFDDLQRRHGISHVVGRQSDFERYAEETGDRSFIDGTRSPVSHVGPVMVYDIAASSTV
jgi:hypothetical protein